MAALKADRLRAWKHLLATAAPAFAHQITECVRDLVVEFLLAEALLKALALLVLNVLRGGRGGVRIIDPRALCRRFVRHLERPLAVYVVSYTPNAS